MGRAKTATVFRACPMQACSIIHASFVALLGITFYTVTAQGHSYRSYCSYFSSNYYSYCYSYRYSLPPLTLQLFPPDLHLLLHLLLHVCYTTRLGPANGLLYWHARIWSRYNAVVAEKRNTCIELACAVACGRNTAPCLQQNKRKSNECLIPFSRVEVWKSSGCTE